jgi:hypothetical protein
MLPDGFQSSPPTAYMMMFGEHPQMNRMNNLGDGCEFQSQKEQKFAFLRFENSIHGSELRKEREEDAPKRNKSPTCACRIEWGIIRMQPCSFYELTARLY